jgi:hypothetical protein
MRINNLIAFIVTMICVSTLSGCASSQDSPQILGMDAGHLSGNAYFMSISATDIQAAQDVVNSAAANMVKERNCKSYTLSNKSVSYHQEVINPELAESLAADAPIYGNSIANQVARSRAEDAAQADDVYTFKATINLVGCKSN